MERTRVLVAEDEEAVRASPNPTLRSSM